MRISYIYHDKIKNNIHERTQLYKLGHQFFGNGTIY